MGVIKRKPYEISIWEDRLVNENGKSYYKEIKLAVIGSDRMESPNRVFDPVLTENVNGEKTLTFSLAFRYYDEFQGEMVENPFYPYLINERKVKLFYNNEWSEFLIKECEESSKENIFNYTAQELFSLELAKLGYDVTLDTSLNNNQGTVIELAKKVLEDTDWEVDEDNSDLLVQYVQEPLYEAIVTQEFQVKDLSSNELISIESGETIYLFYSYVNNKIADNVQFIREKDSNKFEYDDDNVITSTNYRIVDQVVYSTNEQGATVIEIGDNEIITVGDPYIEHQGYRLVYNIRTTYDPVMDRTVDIYQTKYNDSVQDIYRYSDYNYSTSDIVVPYITNGSNFNILENGDLQGWENTTWTPTEQGAKVIQPMKLVTYPDISYNSTLNLLREMSEVNGYLEMKFNGVAGDAYANTYFNDGFNNNASIIDHISAGEKFVLRTRYYTADSQHGDLIAGAPSTSNEGIRVVVAKYERVQVPFYLDEDAKKSEQEAKQQDATVDYTTPLDSYKVLPNEIVLDFTGEFVKSPNVIENGVFNNAHTQYLVDDVIQAPSTAYIYKTAEDSTEYIWHSKLQRYIRRDISDADFSTAYPGFEKPAFADYYLTTAVAKRSFSNEDLSDPTFKLGIFLYIKDSSLVDRYVYLQDIQLTRYYEDANKQPVLIGNVPTAISTEVNHFYLKPGAGVTAQTVNTYDSLAALANELGIEENSIKPLYNENSEKILSIQASNSNYFDILQSLCETFECWLDIRVAHEDDGSIRLDSNFNPIKRVAFKEYAGKDNFAGFKNGINLEGINRNIDSNEIVTKLIVDPVQSEYSDTGSIDIQRAKANPSKQSYILNFSYYLNRGLITDTEACNEDVNKFYTDVREKNEKITEYQNEFIQIQSAINKVAANRNVYTELIDEATKEYNEAIQEFYDITDMTYDAFVIEHNKKVKEEEKKKESGTDTNTTTPTNTSNDEDPEESEDTEEKEEKETDFLENDTVVDIIGVIYVSTAAINNYAGLLTNIDEEYRNLDLKCYGAKDYAISVTSIPSTQLDTETINPSTKVVIDNYTTDIAFQLTDRNGGVVSYKSSPNDRIFEVSNATEYEYIKFTQIPKHYKLKFYANDTPIELDRDKAMITPFKIYDSVEGKSLSKRFVLIPEADYLEEHLGYERRINKLIEEKKQLEKEFYKKYSRFLQEGTWSSQDYIDAELYYLDALQVSNTSAQPKVTYTIDVLEVSQLDGLQNYDFRVGDKTYVEDPDFFGYIRRGIPQTYQINDQETGIFEEQRLLVVESPVREEVIVSEVEWHLDEPDTNTITVQNYKTRFEDLFQRISATVQTVQRNEITYPKTSSILDQSGLINSDLLANSLNGIGGVGFALTTNGSVQATQDGLVIRDLSNSANVMRLASTGLQVSTDGGNNWSTAINAAGISTDTLTAGTINTQKIWLMDGNSPSFRWDKAGLNAYGLDDGGNQRYDLKTYVRFDKYGLYGIKNDEDYVAGSLNDVKNKAYFGVTWDGFFIKNSYTNGRVEITSDDDFRVLTTDENGNDHTRIKIGAVEKDSTGAPTKYGINIMNDDGQVVFDTGDDGNIAISGTINAQAGNFDGVVTVGADESNLAKPYITIDGTGNNPTISSSNYSDSAGTGWIIDSNGDATFSNVSVRGAIKTAVFEYEEIQAVGGAFLFRPSSTIKGARYVATEITEENDEGEEITFETYYHYENGEKVYNDLIVTVEKPLMFRVNNWVKVSNYNSETVDPSSSLTEFGLTHIYEVSAVDFTSHTEEQEIIGEDGQVIHETVTIEPTYELTLAGACAILDGTDIGNVEGGALIDFGNEAGTQNYGIGINSSDNYVNLPPRTISLFETIIHPNDPIKVTYNMRGILGTLPAESTMTGGVDSEIYSNMQGTQGIYTDNMYLGDENQFVAFYEDDNGKQLKIKANQIMFEVSDPQPGEDPWKDIADIEAEGVPGPPGPAGEDAIYTIIDSSAGNVFINGVVSTILRCYVYKGGIDITHDNNYIKTYTWKKINIIDGSEIPGWTPTPVPLEPNAIRIGVNDVNSKAVFQCTVNVEEA